jgi:ATP-binding cassette subfamily C protein
MIAQSSNEKKIYATSEKITPLKESIDFQNVSFKYPGTEKASILNINLKIKKGETFGIVGPTGAGKTTLINVLLGLIPPEGGVLVDGKSIYQNLAGWQNQLGYVPQNIYLLDDTLRQNIAFGLRNTDIDEERIQKTLKLAHLDLFVASLPKGLDTLVGEYGVRLSGGQGQRIGIARALYHDPEVLVLDEATSSLDNETEHKVSQEIKEVSHSRTSIIIAHRLGTVLHCNRIAYMKEGTIIDIGGFEELASRNPEFQKQIELGSFTKTA